MDLPDQPRVLELDPHRLTADQEAACERFRILPGRELTTQDVPRDEEGSGEDLRLTLYTT